MYICLNTLPSMNTLSSKSINTCLCGSWIFITSHNCIIPNCPGLQKTIWHSFHPCYPADLLTSPWEYSKAICTYPKAKMASLIRLARLNPFKSLKFNNQPKWPPGKQKCLDQINSIKIPFTSSLEWTKLINPISHLH